MADASKVLDIVIEAIDNASGVFKTLGASGQASADELEESSARSSISIDRVGTASEESAERVKLSNAEIIAAYRDMAVGVGESDATASDATASFSKMGGSMVDTLAPLLAVLGAYEGAKDIIESASTATDEYNTASAALKNTIKTTHDAVGLSVVQLLNMADANSKNTTITKGANLAAEAILVNYSSLGKSIFPQAAGQIDNLATSFANIQGKAVPSTQNVTQAAKLLGKALQDPATGMTAFTRVGITFTAQQVAQVKAIQDSSNATDKQALSIKGISAAGATALTNWSNMTAVQQTAAEAADGLTAVQIAQAQAMGKQNGVVSAQKQLMSDLGDVVSGKAAAAMTTYQGKVANAKKQFDDWTGSIINVIQKGLEKLGAALLKVGVFITNHKTLLEIVTGAALGLALVLGGALVVAIGSAILGFLSLDLAMLPWIATAMAIGAVALLIITHWSDVKQWFNDFIKWVVTAFDDCINSIKTVWNSIVSFISHVISDITNAIKSGVSGFGNLLLDAGEDLIKGLVKGIENAAGDAVDAVKKVGNDITSAAKDVLKIFSPSKVFDEEIGQQIPAGMAQGITSNSKTAINAVKQLGNSVASAGSTNISTGSSSAVSSTGASANGSGVTLNIYYQGRGQFSYQDAVAMGKEIITVLRSQGLSTDNLNNLASLR